MTPAAKFTNRQTKVVAPSRQHSNGVPFQFLIAGPMLLRANRHGTPAALISALNAGLVLREVLAKQSPKLVCRRVVGRGIGPQTARPENFSRHNRTLGHHVKAKDRVGFGRSREFVSKRSANPSE